MGVGEIDMKDDGQALKVPNMKRKIQNNSESSQAKKGVAGNTRAVKVAERKDTESDFSMEEDSDADSSSSDSKMAASQRPEEYSVEKN